MEENPKPQEYKLPGVEAPDWTISELYNKSFEIVKKHKVLWVFGTAVAAFAGGGISSNFNSFSRVSDRIDFQKYFQNQPSPDHTNQISQVLGTAASSATVPSLLQFVTNIPVYLWILLGIEVLAFIVISTIIGLASNAWANASLFQAIQSALNGKNTSIADSSQKAFPSIKPLALLYFVPGLIFWLTSILVFGLLAIGLSASGSGLRVVFIALLIFALLVWLYAAIHLTFIYIWAPRRIVLDEKPWKESFWASYRISRRKKWAMLILGLVNTILSGLIIGIPLAIVVGLLVSGALGLSASNLTIGAPLLFLGGFLFLAFILGGQVLGGVLTAFKASVWTIAYDKIKGKYDK